MLPDRVSNPGPLTYESGALPIALHGQAPSLEQVQITISVLCNFALIQVLPFLNNLKNLDPSYKMDLDFWDCFGRKNHSVL